MNQAGWYEDGHKKLSYSVHKENIYNEREDEMERWTCFDTQTEQTEQ